MPALPPAVLQKGYQCIVAPRSGAEFEAKVIGTPKLVATNGVRYDTAEVQLSNTFGNSPVQAKDAVRLYEDGKLVFHGLVVSRPESTFNGSGQTLRFTAASRPFILWKKLTRDWSFPGIDDEEALDLLFGTNLVQRYAFASFAEFFEVFQTNLVANRLQLAETAPGVFQPSGYGITKTLEVGGEILEATYSDIRSGSRVGVYDDDFAGSVTPAIVNGAQTTAYYDAVYEWFRLTDRNTVYTENFPDATVLSDQEGTGVVNGKLTLLSTVKDEDFEAATHDAYVAYEKASVTTIANRTFTTADLPGPTPTSPQWQGLKCLRKDDDEVYVLVRANYFSNGWRSTYEAVWTVNVNTNTWAIASSVSQVGSSAGTEVLVSAPETPMFYFRGKAYWFFRTYTFIGSTLNHGIVDLEAGIASTLNVGLSAIANVLDPNFFEWKDELYVVGLFNGGKTWFKWNGSNNWIATTEPFSTGMPVITGSDVEDRVIRQGRDAQTVTLNLGTNNPTANPPTAGGSYTWDGNAWVANATQAAYELVSGSKYYKRGFVNPVHGANGALMVRMDFATGVVQVRTQAANPVVNAPYAGMGAKSVRVTNESIMSWGTPRSILKGSLRFSVAFPVLGSSSGEWTVADGRYRMRIIANGVVQWFNGSTWTSLATALAAAQPNEVRVLMYHMGSVGTWTARVYLRGVDNGLIGSAIGAASNILGIFRVGNAAAGHDVYVDGVTWVSGFQDPVTTQGYAVLAAQTTTYPIQRFGIAVTEVKPAGTNIAYMASFDGGTTWYNVTPGATIDILFAQGSSVLLRADLTTTTPGTNPELDQVVMTMGNGYNATTQKVTTLNLNPDTGLTAAFVTVLAATELDLPAGTSVTWRVSTNGGVNWSNATLGAETTIPPAERGTDVRVEATLSNGGNQAVTSAVKNLHVQFRDAASGTTITGKISRDGGQTYHTIVDGQTIDFRPFTSENPKNRLVLRYDLSTSIASASPSVQDVEVQALTVGFTWVRLHPTKVVPTLQAYPLNAFYQHIGPMLEELVQNLGVEAWWELDSDTGIYYFCYNSSREGQDVSGRVGEEIVGLVMKTDGLKAADRWYLIGETS